tara:strand:+ start:431 stop:838 length:408 start_codon:yes stop_codon:yes gene_type:complete
MARSVREIDRNDDKYVGIRFPLGYSPEGFFYKTKTVLEQSKANLRNLLLTTPGERIFQPNFGSRLKNIVFEQGQDIPNRIEETIRSSVDNFLPYINIINVFTIQEQNQVNVQVEFSVPLNPDTIERLNFDFRIGD